LNEQCDKIQGCQIQLAWLKKVPNETWTTSQNTQELENSKVNILKTIEENHVTGNSETPMIKGSKTPIVISLLTESKPTNAPNNNAIKKRRRIVLKRKVPKTQ